MTAQLPHLFHPAFSVPDRTSGSSPAFLPDLGGYRLGIAALAETAPTFEARAVCRGANHDLAYSPVNDSSVATWQLRFSGIGITN
jgi:hypothetical protein